MRLFQPHHSTNAKCGRTVHENPVTSTSPASKILVPSGTTLNGQQQHRDVIVMWNTFAGRTIGHPNNCCMVNYSMAGPPSKARKSMSRTRKKLHLRISVSAMTCRSRQHRKQENGEQSSQSNEKLRSQSDHCS